MHETVIAYHFLKGSRKHKGISTEEVFSPGIQLTNNAYLWIFQFLIGASKMLPYKTWVRWMPISFPSKKDL